MELLTSKISINSQISPSISFYTLRKNKINPLRINPFRPSFPIYVFPLRKTQISAHFGSRPTNRQNYLRKKFNQKKQVTHPPQNPSHEFDKVGIFDSSLGTSVDNVSMFDDKVGTFESNFDEKVSNFEEKSSLDKDLLVDDNNSYSEGGGGVEELDMGLDKKKFGESIMWNKLENWVDQYKKDSEFWGIGSGPIFTIYHDAEGKVERVVVDEAEIMRRSRVGTVLDGENEGMDEVDYKISFAKDLAKEMESGSNVIPKSSSVAKFLVSGVENKSSFVETVRDVTLKSGSFSRIGRGGVLVLCGLFVVWVVRSVFFGVEEKDVKEEYTGLEKEMLRRKMKARTMKERMVKGNVEVMQDPIEVKGVSLERPRFDKEEVVSTIVKAKGSNRGVGVVEYSGSENNEFMDKIEEIKVMARHAREIEKRDALSGDDDLEEESDDEYFTESSETTESMTSTYPKDEIGQFNDEPLVEKGQFSISPNAVIPNGTGSLKNEVTESSRLEKGTIHLDDPGRQLSPRENSPRKKLRIIKSAKEAREYLSTKHKKPDVNQRHEVKNDEVSKTADSFPLNGIDISHPLEEYGVDSGTGEGNLGSQSDLGKSKISSVHEVNVNNRDIEKAVFELPVKEETNIGTSQKYDGENDSTSNKVDHGSEENETLLGLEIPGTTVGNEVNGRTEQAPSVNKESWLEKNFHEMEPIIEKMAIGYRDNYQVARQSSKDEIMELVTDASETELEWMKDERLREIVFKVRDNELSGRDPFHLMDEADKQAFFGGLEKKVEQENEKLRSLHEYFHSNIENLDYGADGISIYDPPEKIIARWKNPPAEKSPEFLNNFAEQRKALVSEGLKNSFLSKKTGKNPVHRSEEPSSIENSPVAANISNPSTEIPKKPLVSSKTVIQGSDGSIRAGKKSGKEYWQHTKKWSQGFLDSYNAETDPDVKATMKDMGKDLDRWITEKEIQEAADLMDRIPEKGQKFIKQKLDKVKREMELFGPQAVVSKYSEYAEEKEEDYLWWLDLPFVLCIEMYTVENGEQRVGFYSLEMAPDLELEPKPYHVIAFEDPSDSKHFCYIIQAHMEMLGTGNAFVVARPPKDAFREAKENGFGVTVVRKGQLQLNIDQTLEEVEELIIEIGSKMYHDKITKERSVDINALMKGVFGITKPTKNKRKRSKRKSKRRTKP